MATTLEAGFVYTQDDGETAMVGFADDQFDTRDYVLLQRTLNPTPADKAMGQDNLHITVNDQSQSCYGGVLSLTLRAQEVSIQLSSEAATTLHLSEELRILLPSDGTDHAQLHESLAKLCASYVQYDRP